MIPTGDQRLSAESYVAVTSHLYRRLSEEGTEIGAVRVPPDALRHIKEVVAAHEEGQPVIPPEPDLSPARRDMGLWPAAVLTVVALVLILWNG